MKSLLIVFGALLLIICLPAFFEATHEARVEDFTQNFAGVDTAAGINSANITLSQDVCDDNVVSITDVTSNETADAPTAASYNSVSRVVNITGLEENMSRTLSVTYEIDSTLLPAGASIFLTLSNWFILFAILGMIAGSIYAFFD